MAYTSIDDPSAYFNVKTYTGTVDHDATAGSTQSVTWDATEDFAVNLLWVKGRSHAQAAQIVDTVRGGTDTSGSGADVGMKKLQPSANAAEVAPTANTNGGIKSIDSDGFTLLSGDDSSDRSNGTCRTSYTYVAWGWKESADAGFDIVGYTGNATDRTISHSLSAVPKVILVKRRTDADSQWAMYHHTLTNNNFLVLNTNGASGTTDHWNDTDPTSSVFSINSTGDEVNVNTSTYIAYLWSEKQGFSKFGKYTGNANANGPFIYTGFRPAMIIIKNTAATEHWRIYDNKRDSFNHMFRCIFPNDTSAESTVDNASEEIDFLSNGIKIRSSAAQLNGSGNVLIYMAFAEAPFVNSNGVPCNAR